MKAFAIVVFLSVLFGHINSMPRDDSDLADTVREIINEIIEGISDPVGIKDVKLKIPSSFLIYGELDVTEISISGLKKLKIDNLTLDPNESRLNFGLSLEDLLVVFETELILHGLAEIDNPLSVHVDLKNVKIEGYAVVAEDRKNVDDLNIVISVDEADVNIKGLLNNEELSSILSQFLTSNLATLLDEAAPAVSYVVSGIVKTVINILLKI